MGRNDHLFAFFLRVLQVISGAAAPLKIIFTPSSSTSHGMPEIVFVLLCFEVVCTLNHPCRLIAYTNITNCRGSQLGYWGCGAPKYHRGWKPWIRWNWGKPTDECWWCCKTYSAAETTCCQLRGSPVLRSSERSGQLAALMVGLVTWNTPHICRRGISTWQGVIRSSLYSTWKQTLRTACVLNLFHWVGCSFLHHSILPFVGTLLSVVGVFTAAVSHDLSPALKSLLMMFRKCRAVMCTTSAAFWRVYLRRTGNRREPI